MTPILDALRKQLISLLQSSAEFGQMPEEVLALLADSLTYKLVHGGEVLVKEGDRFDSLFILVSGRLRVSRKDSTGHLLLYNEIFPGECLGEVGLSLDQPSSADIYAVRDSMLAVLTREKFEHLLVKYPIVTNRIFTQAIYNHLHHIRPVDQRRRSTALTVVPLSPDVDSVSICARICNELGKVGRIHFLPAATSRYFEATESAFALADSLQLNKDRLEAENDYLVYEAEPHSSSWTQYACRQADQIVFVANGHSRSEVSDFERMLAAESGIGFGLSRKHLLLVYPKRSNLAPDMAPWGKGRDLERIYPVALDSNADFSRLVRFLTSRAVGLVMGGGGARGFAHLGVLQALEEAGISVDILGGNSMGALIGSLYAYGVPRVDIHKLILQHTGSRFLPNVPIVSLLSNVPFERALRGFFGDTRVESLWVPFFSTACNLTQARTVVLDQGPLWSAVLASNSPAGLLPPILREGDLLVDGAILENVPVDAMRTRIGIKMERRRGNGKVIAVDVDVRENLSAPREMERISAGAVLKSRINRALPAVPSMANILFQAAHIGGIAQRAKTVAMADYFLEPPVSNYPLMNYGNAEAIIEAGYRHASEQIKGWAPLS